MWLFIFATSESKNFIHNIWYKLLEDEANDMFAIKTKKSRPLGMHLVIRKADMIWAAKPPCALTNRNKKKKKSKSSIKSETKLKCNVFAFLFCCLHYKRDNKQTPALSLASRMKKENKKNISHKQYYIQVEPVQKQLIMVNR